MHEGDHSILDEEHDHKHPHKHPHAHDHTHAGTPPEQARAFGPRIIAGVIVGVAVVVFLIWRLM